MKNLLVLVFGLISFSAHASDTCLAERVEEIGYASTLNYRVMCGAQVHYTESIPTAIIFPLPYDSEGKARKNLLKDMHDQGYEFAAVIEKYKRHGDFYVFEKKPMNANYCLVWKYNKIRSGIDRREVRFDVTIVCQGHDEDVETYQGVTESELSREMLSMGGFRKLFDSSLEPEYNGGLPKKKGIEVSLYRNF